MAQAVNVSDEAQVAGVVDARRRQFGRVDLLVANAGIVRSGPVEEMSLADWRAGDGRQPDRLLS
jgi:NAD(P)-dependent dehydrogenase (short-subunit alcohol dehydrogenase family)